MLGLRSFLSAIVAISAGHAELAATVAGQPILTIRAAVIRRTKRARPVGEFVNKLRKFGVRAVDRFSLAFLSNALIQNLTKIVQQSLLNVDLK